jgi:O-antigen ligase
MSNLIYFAGPAFYFLYLLFPVDNAMAQALEDFSGHAMGVHFGRVLGVTLASLAVFHYMLSRYGLRGMLDQSRPWRLVFAFLCFALSLLGGFRSAVLLLALICAFQFYFEGLFRTRLFLVLALIALLGGLFLTAYSTRLPLSVQRSLSMLPIIEISPIARQDAQASTDWRVEMWRMLLPEVREHLWLGKGFALNPTDMYLTTESVKRGLANDYEASMVAGDYHSGPLSVIIPFGIFGLSAFVWLLIAGARLLYRNYRFGDPSFRYINIFLLSFFLTRSIYYFIGFGAFGTDMPMFLGILGFSIAVNGRISVVKPASIQLQKNPVLAPVPATA